MDTSARAFFQSWDLFSGFSIALVLLVLLFFVGVFRLRRKNKQAFSLTRVATAFLGYVAIYVAVVGPPDGFSSEFFFAHMAQHLLLAMLAAPLILLSNPMSAYVWSLPTGLRMGAAALLERRGPIRSFLTFFTNPKLAMPLFIATFYVWHLSTFYESAIQNEVVHFVEHLTMFGFAIFFWWPLIGPSPIRTKMKDAYQIAYLFITMTAMAALGAGITLANAPFYEHYIARGQLNGIDPHMDQRLAGVLLWVPGNMVFIVALIATLRRFIRRDMKNA